MLVQGAVVVEAAAEQHPLEEEVGEEPRCLALVLVAAEAELYLLAEAEVEAVQGLLVVVAGAVPCFPAEGEEAAEEERPSHLAAAAAAAAEAEVVEYQLHPAVVEVEAAEGEEEQPWLHLQRRLLP